MKKLSIAIAGAVFSAFYLGMEGANASFTTDALSDSQTSLATQLAVEQAQQLAGQQNLLLVPPDAPGRESVWVESRGKYTFLATSQETNGALSAFNFAVDPLVKNYPNFGDLPGGPKPHYHPQEDETLYILSGNLSIFTSHDIVNTADEATAANYTRTDVPAGTLINLPKGRPHYFKNFDETTSPQILSIVRPGGLDEVFNIIGTPGDQPEPDYSYFSTPEYFAKLGQVFATFGPPGDSPPPDQLKNFVVVTPEPLANPPAFADTLADRPSFGGTSGDEYTSLLTAQETGGFEEFEVAVNVGGSFSQPIPDGVATSIYVLDGELSITGNNQTSVATAGTFAYVAPGSSYTFNNSGDTQLKTLLSYSPVPVPFEPSSTLGILAWVGYVGARKALKHKQKETQLGS